jgi:hypothetical protein
LTVVDVAERDQVDRPVVVWIVVAVVDGQVLAAAALDAAESVAPLGLLPCSLPHI